jgi:hypothetical protein
VPLEVIWLCVQVWTWISEANLASFACMLICNWCCLIMLQSKSISMFWLNGNTSDRKPLSFVCYEVVCWNECCALLVPMHLVWENNWCLYPLLYFIVEAWCFVLVLFISMLVLSSLHPPLKRYRECLLLVYDFLDGIFFCFFWFLTCMCYAWCLIYPTH